MRLVIMFLLLATGACSVRDAEASSTRHGRFLHPVSVRLELNGQGAEPADAPGQVPALSQSWLFRGAVVLLLVGLGVGAYRWRVASIENRNRELAIEVADRTLELVEQAVDLEALYQADELLERQVELQPVLQALVDIAVDVLHADASAVFAWDERQERVAIRVARNFSPRALGTLSFARGEGLVARVIETGEPVMIEDAARDLPVAPERADVVDAVLAEGIRSFMHLPIRSEKGVFGVFTAGYDEPRAHGERERRLFTALAQRAALAVERAQYFAEAQEVAALEERTRLARDLHDAVTQTLFSASLMAEVLPELWESDPAEGRQLLDELRQMTRGALAEMRTLLLELRPAALVEASLGDLLRQLGETVSGRSGIRVVVSTGGCQVPDLPDNVHVAFYRITQEALNNVVKHAQAKRANVTLCCSAGCEANEAGRTPDQRMRVELLISDDGQGFDPGYVSPDHLGLQIIRERSQSIGATLAIASEPGVGTTVHVVWDSGRENGSDANRRADR